MKFTIERTTTPVRYDMRTTDSYAWAIIVVDERSGFLAIQSDYGDYQYMWPRHGRKTFRHFLVQMDEGYFINKVTGGERKFDMESTVKVIKDELAGRLKTEELDVETHKTLLEELSDVADNSTTEYEFYDQITQTEEMKKIYDNPYDVPFRTMDPPQAAAFFQKIWPAFIETLKKEIEDERRQEGSESL